MFVNYILKCVCSVVCVCFFLADASAEQMGGPFLIASVRPYIGSNIVYIATDSASLCGTTMFSIDVSSSNGKMAYVAILIAQTSRAKVMLEPANATSCTGWGTQLQSVTVLSE